MSENPSPPKVTLLHGGKTAGMDEFDTAVRGLKENLGSKKLCAFAVVLIDEDAQAITAAGQAGDVDIAHILIGGLEKIKWRLMARPGGA